MLPTLAAHGDVVLVEKLSLLTSSPSLSKIKHNDVIVCTSPQDPSKVICKRVIGKAGDLVWGGVMVERVPPGHVWVEGDNKAKSNDSRTFGPVPAGLVRGRVIVKVWPWRQFGTFL
jgi:signal peptidase I